MLDSLKSFVHSFYVLLFESDRFKVRLSISCDLDFLIYECPGLWASDAELKELTDMLLEVAKAGQDGKEMPEYGCLLGDREDLKTRVISIAIDKNEKRAVGFSAQSYVDIVSGNFKERLLHLGLIFVDPSYQGKSVSYLLAMFPNILISIKSGFRDCWVSNVTQVPAVYGLVASNYFYTYPGTSRKFEQGFYHRYLATQLYKNHKSVFGVGEEAEWNSEMQIIENSYTGGADHLKKSFAAAPKHRNPVVNEICEEHLDYERGDDFVQIGKLSPSTFIQLFKSKKSRQTRLQMSINILIFSLAAMILPVLRWFIPNQQVSLDESCDLPLVI
ncbi:MAG: hypothetical protein CL674_03385 [Bdellovibrionaceae bacterium]|nr:hypothetical protein [Pseudobdellovibrionaceae bacterium]|tara:strand:- start:18224 stop:19213 length:990 start_codon:yes stop_codon:yes gene_type:complete